MSDKHFVEAEGFVHLVSVNNSEYTLCGDAFDLGSEVQGYEWRETKRRSVTCSRCIREILNCRGARTAKEQQEKQDGNV